MAAQRAAEDTTAREPTAHFSAELRHPDHPDALLRAAYVHTGP
ncbi:MULTISPECIES: hypothetical protein [Streptomyces]|uniref:Uncharacterized protein n=2 Tax=Streptomyces bottropensis TaxID=42235 RepID=M3EYQ2_9ACTN|nr:MULTISPECIES: hypothetical protein [Streptomyces]EMF54373.1 hypothetical protein SBD_4042 [Streptomyces bottropensis ATCC 25435]